MTFKIDTAKIHSLILPTINDLGLEIYEINCLNEFDKNILQILLQQDEQHSTVNFELLIRANEQIAAILDTNADLNLPYILEVSSAGLEKTIHTKAQLIAAVNAYVYLDINSQNLHTNATLTAYADDEFLFKYFVKGVPKQIKCKYEDINFIRYAVKF